MCLRPSPAPPVPEDTARVARQAFRRGNLYLALRDEFGTFFSDPMFQKFFGASGPPAEAPWRLALVTLLQFAENLSDRQAAEAVRARLDWKYLLSLELTDEGFDHSVLCEFRERLLANAAARLLFETLLERFRERKLLKERGRQRTDSTHVLAAVRTLHRLELVGETLRYALNTLAEAAPEWLRKHALPAWAERYGRRIEESRLPRARAERDALSGEIGADGFYLLAALDAAATPGKLRTLPAVRVLRQVWEQQYHREDPPSGAGPAVKPVVRWHTGAELPPAGEQIHSPYDPEARYCAEEEFSWVGYTVHLTESCDPGSPALITDVQTTPATVPDQQALPVIQAALNERHLLPCEQLVDSGYVDANNLVTSEQEYGIALIGPTLANSSWQAREGAGFATADFRVDWEAKTAQCPGDKTSVRWQERQKDGRVSVDFAREDCRVCPFRPQCTRAADHGRRLTLQPEAPQRALAAARAREKTPEFWEKYRARAGVEGTHNQAIRRCGLRRCRYRGEAKTALQEFLTGAALNLVRVGYWILGTKRRTTRKAAYLRLAHAVA